MLARVKTGVAAHEAGTHVACDAQSKRALVAGSYGLAAFEEQIDRTFLEKQIPAVRSRQVGG